MPHFSPLPPESLPLIEPAPSRTLHGRPAEILLRLWQEEATGILTLDFADSRCVLYLRGGLLVASRGAERE